MLRVAIARSIYETEQLRPAWEALQGGGQGTMFQSYAWNRTAVQVFGAREEPFIVHAESDSGAALVPAAISSLGRITLLGEALFDYRDVLSAGDPEVGRAAWARLAQVRLPLSVTAIRGEDARPRWSELGPHFFCHAPQITAADTSREELEAAHRRLGRFWRRALRAGAELRQYDGTAGALLRWIYRQKAAQLGPRPDNLFDDPLRVEFMVAVAAAEPAACEIFTLEMGSRVMAALVTFRDRQTRRFYTVFYEPEFAEYSPGNILLFEICRRTLEQGMNCDLMTGEQPYKQRLAASLVPLFRVEASAETLAAVGRVREPIGEIAA